MPDIFLQCDPEGSIVVMKFNQESLGITYEQFRWGIRFVEHIPKSAIGKILRRVLRDAGQQQQLVGVEVKATLSQSRR